MKNFTTNHTNQLEQRFTPVRVVSGKNFPQKKIEYIPAIIIIIQKTLDFYYQIRYIFSAWG